MNYVKEIKNYSISLIRLMSMTFIIICHFMQYYDCELAWWFNVGVQVFLCMSGFLYGNKKIEEPIDFIVKNFKKILIPYFCFLISISILYFKFSRENISFSILLGATLGSKTIKGLEHLWFIAYILFCYIITPYLNKITDRMRNLKITNCIFSLLLILILGQLLSNHYSSFFLFSRISCYIIGYFLAFILKNYGMKALKKVYLVLALFCILLNGLKIYAKYIAYIPLNPYINSYAHVLLGVIIFLTIFIFIKKVKANVILKFSDKYSYCIYIVHQLFILSPFKLMEVTNNIYINWIIVAMSILVSSLVLKYISDNATFIMEKMYLFFRIKRSYKIVMLCGDKSFKDEFLKVQDSLTLKGNIVLSVDFHDSNNETDKQEKEQTKEMLQDMRKMKIDLADELFVININGYIDENTNSEIEYARKCGKKISFLENV